MDTETPAPLDAYLTAKPGEPVFVLQGGDPLAEYLVKIWVAAARIRAGRIPPSALAGVEVDLLSIIAANLVTDEREQSGLLIRATQAEQVSWAMDDYRAGRTAGEKAETPAEKIPEEKIHLDVYDMRRRCAEKLANLFSALEEFRTDLIRLGYFTEGSELDNQFQGLIFSARTLEKLVNIKRGHVVD